MKYRLYDEPNNGTAGQDCGTFELSELPPRVQQVIADSPDDGEWRLPALSEGDVGDELDDLTIVCTAVDHE